MFIQSLHDERLDFTRYSEISCRKFLRDSNLRSFLLVLESLPALTSTPRRSYVAPVHVTAFCIAGDSSLSPWLVPSAAPRVRLVVAERRAEWRSTAAARRSRREERSEPLRVESQWARDEHAQKGSLRTLGVPPNRVRTSERQSHPRIATSQRSRRCGWCDAGQPDEERSSNTTSTQIPSASLTCAGEPVDLALPPGTSRNSLSLSVPRRSLRGRPLL
jgi:hypothetical protein